MSTHRTPPGSTPRRSGGGTRLPPAGTSPAGVPRSGHGRTAEPPRGARPGKGAFARSADAAVVTGRGKAAPDRPRTGPDKKARTRALASPPARGVTQSAPRSPDRHDARHNDRHDVRHATSRDDGRDHRPGRDAEAGHATRTPDRGPQRARDTTPRDDARVSRGARAGQGARDAAPNAARPDTQARAAHPARPSAETAQPRPRTDPRIRTRPGEDDSTSPADALARREAAPHHPAAAPDEAASRATSAKGTWLYGSHAVAAALANPDRHLRRLLLTEEAEAAMRGRMAGAWALTPERIDRARLDQLLGRDAVHGGVALLADPLSPPSLADALARPGPVLVLDQVSDPRNVGAILRSAASFGACAVVVQDRNAPDETGVMAKAASGAMERVPLLRAVNLARTLGALKAAGLWVVGLDAAGGRLSGPALSERRVALVLGAEGAGLRRLTRETCDELAGLPMPGGMESLNVSAAAAVALYELTRAPPETT